MSAKKATLSRRIVWAFVLLTMFTSGLFAIAIVQVVYRVEEQLLSAELNRSLERLLHQSATDHMTTLNRETRFYSNQPHPLAQPIPENLRELHVGFHEIFSGDTDYHAMVREADGKKYILLQDQGDFETREQVMFAAVAIGFVLCVFISWLLGRLLSRQVIAPVILLAEKVTASDVDENPSSHLAAEFALDEIGQLAASFDQAFNLLAEALQREKLFTADISHELRTPLMVISSSCELLEARADLAPAQMALVQRIHRAGSDMQQISQICLQLARNQQGIANVMATLPAVAEEQLQQWCASANAKQLRLQLCDQRSTKNDLPLLFDKSMLSAVMGNLLRNAVHYSAEGDIVITLSNTGFSVEDNGPGIPAEQQAEMFLPFRRGSHNFSEGVGLGLSLVQRICRHQGWHITLSERQPQGCCFQVVLNPAASAITI